MKKKSVAKLTSFLYRCQSNESCKKDREGAQRRSDTALEMEVIGGHAPLGEGGGADDVVFAAAPSLASSGDGGGGKQ